MEHVYLLLCFLYSEEVFGVDESGVTRRQRSESSTGDDTSHATHVAVSYIDKHYPQYKSVSSSCMNTIIQIKSFLQYAFILQCLSFSL